VYDDLVMALAMAVWLAWEAHKKYLEAPGLIALVSYAGVLEGGPRHPLRNGGMVPWGPRFWDPHRDRG